LSEGSLVVGCWNLTWILPDPEAFYIWAYFIFPKLELVRGLLNNFLESKAEVEVRVKLPVLIGDGLWGELIKLFPCGLTGSVAAIGLSFNEYD
jgi:hypothetical protein